MDRLQIWVINLDRAPQRLERIAAQLQRLQLPYVRLSAVDAQALTPAQRAELDEAAYRRLHGMNPVLGELGCFLSHVEVARRFLAGSAEVALVLEDDALIHDTLPAVLQGLLANPRRWDMVKLSAVHSGTPVPVLTVSQGHALAVMLSRCRGSSAYLMNRRAAELYATGLLPMRLPYDHVFDLGWRYGLKVRMVTPTPCTHDDTIATTIGAAPGPSRKFHWTQRLAAHRYRVGVEVRRVAHGLMQLLRERLVG
jgi:glycosyl transferase family 25